MTCPQDGMPGAGGPSSTAPVDPLTTLQTPCIRRAERVSELKNWNLILALPFMISEPLCPYL